MTDPYLILAIAAIFLLAGTVKGVIGLGLPPVSLALLVLMLDLPEAMAVVLVPSLMTNLWQATIGGNARAIIRRLWSFLIVVFAMVFVGAMALTRFDLTMLRALLGALLMIYAGANLIGFRLTIGPRYETALGLLFGSANGVLAGMTGSFVVPGVWFLQAIGLKRDELIQAMGITFSAATLGLAFALQGNGLLTVELGTFSVASLIPALIGMVIGQRFRRALPDAVFQRVFFSILLVLGAYLLVGASSIFA